MLRNVCAAVITVLVAAFSAVPTAAAAASAAQLSVTLTNDAASVVTGDAITYTGEVQNLGGDEVTVTIVLRAPEYVELADVAGATLDGSQAVWTTSVSPGESATFTAGASIGEIPDTERRVTTTASVYIDGGRAPIVATADASPITGVDDTPAASGTTAPTDERVDASATMAWIVGGVLSAALAVGLALVLTRRRLGSQTSDHAHARRGEVE